MSVKAGRAALGLMPRVYVLNKGGYDYSAAERYGSLVYCTDGPLRRDDVNQMVRLITTAMKDSGPSDYIVLTSLASLCAIACSVFAVKHGCLNLLIYRKGVYHEHCLIFDKGSNNGKLIPKAASSR